MSYDRFGPGQLQARIQLNDIQSNLPYTTFEPDDSIAMTDGSLSVGMEIFPPHLDLMLNEEINSTQRALTNLVNSLPEGSAVQFDLLCTNDCTPQMLKHFKPGEDLGEERELFTIERELVKKYLERRAAEGTLRHWRNFVFVNYHEPRANWQSPKTMIRDMVKDAIKGFKSKSVLQEEIQALDDRLAMLRNIRNGMYSTFENLAWFPENMQTTDWTEMLMQIFNPRLHALGYKPYTAELSEYDGERKRQLPNFDVAQTFLFSQIYEYSAGYWEMDGHHHMIFTLPEIKAGSTIFGMLRLLTRVGIPNMRISVVGHPCDPAAYVNQIRKDLNGLRNEQRRHPDNMEINKAIQDRLQEQDQVLQGMQKVFETRITCHIWDRDPDRLAEYQSLIGKAGQEMGGARWLLESHNSLPYFFSTIPGWTNDRDGNRLNDFKSVSFVDLLPTFQMFDPSAGLRGTDRGVQAPVIMENSEGGIAGWNPLDMQRGTNYNGIIIGATRRGKSVGQQHIMCQMLPLMPRFCCIDLGESSKTLIEALGGVHYTVMGKDGKGKCINPFGGSRGMPDAEQLEDYTYVVEQMLVEPDKGELTKNQRNILSAAIQETFRKNLGREIFVDDLYQTLANKGEDAYARDMATQMQYWVKGIGARFVNGPSDVNLDNPFVGFELGGIEKKRELAPVLLAIILNHAKRMAAEHPGVPKAIWTDEFAQLGKIPALARYMELAYRTYGKTGVGVWTLSQQIGDYGLCAAEGNISIFLNNVGQMIIFGQDESAIDELRERTSLSENALAYISRLRTIKGQFAEAVVVQRQQTRDFVVGKVVFRSNPIRYWLSSSQANDRRIRELYTERFARVEGTRQRALQRAILTLAEEMPAGFDQAGLGGLTPQLAQELSQNKAEDEEFWDPLESNLAKRLGLSRSKPAEYMNAGAREKEVIGG